MGCQDYGIEEDTGYSFFCSMFDSFVLCVNKQLYMQFLQIEDESGRVGSWIKGVNQTKDLLIPRHCLLKNSKNQ